MSTHRNAPRRRGLAFLASLVVGITTATGCASTGSIDEVESVWTPPPVATPGWKLVPIAAYAQPQQRVVIQAPPPAPPASGGQVASAPTGYTPTTSPLLNPSDSAPHGRGPAAMDPLLLPPPPRVVYRPYYVAPTYYPPPAYYGRPYGYYSPAPRYYARPGISFGLGFGLGHAYGHHRHSHFGGGHFGGGHRGHFGGHHFGGGHHRHH